MLHTSRLKITEGQLMTVAGASSGVRVKCSNQALPVYNDLVTLANAGNHWAGLVVRGLRGLTSGRLHMDNIYVQKDNSVAYGRGIFYAVLPGVTATLQNCDDGSFELISLKADNNYLQLQKDKQQPGLWRISKDVDTDPEFQEDGTVLKKDYRPVVISDRSSEDPRDIAKAARNDLIKLNTTIKSMVSNSGFDLHHTPGDSDIVGLKPASKALATAGDSAIVESAILLANTMYKARNIEGVLWFSDWGGSAILTRALQILHHEKNTTLEKHAIFLNRPTSNSTTALALAKELKLSLAGNGGKSTGFRKNEIMGNHLSANVTRQGAFDASILGLSGAGAAFSLMGAATTVAAPTVAGVAGAVVGVAGALYFVATTVKSGAAKLSGKKYK